MGETATPEADPPQRPALRAFTILVAGEKGGAEVVASYEVLARDAETAARLIRADMSARGETLTAVDHAETAPVANPLAEEGVRFRTARA